MQTLSLPHHTLSLYRTLEDFPVGQFLRYQNYWEQAASTEEPITVEASAQELAFALCVAAINGHPVEPLADTELPTLVALLKSYGVTESLLTAELATTRHSTFAELKRLFPVLLADLTPEAMTDENMQRRFLAVCAFEAADLAAYTPSTRTVESMQVPVVNPTRTARQVDEHLLDLLQPTPLGKRYGLLAQDLRERAFASLYELLTHTGTSSPEQLPVVSFVHALEAARTKLPAL